MIEQADEIGRGHDRHAVGTAADPARLAALRGRADQAFLALAGMKRGEQDAGRGDHPPIERQFAHRHEVRHLFCIDDAHRAQQRERYRQVVVRALLGQVGRREVDGDPLGRKGKPHRGKRGGNALAALAHGLVRQADDSERRQARRDLTLHFDGACLESEIGHGRNQRDHEVPLHWLRAGLTMRGKDEDAKARNSCLTTF